MAVGQEVIERSSGGQRESGRVAGPCLLAAVAHCHCLLLSLVDLVREKERERERERGGEGEVEVRVLFEKKESSIKAPQPFGSGCSGCL